MGYAVISCGCKNAWAVELRHFSSKCTRCGRSSPIAKRQRHWTGDDAKEAGIAASAIRMGLAQGTPLDQLVEQVMELQSNPRPVRHDSPIDAAAAKSREVINASERAEIVALWLTRLLGPSSDATFREALEKAGLEAERAEKEVIRMLACDVIYEPKMGYYAALVT
jgi:hypothetical protein